MKTETEDSMDQKHSIQSANTGFRSTIQQLSYEISRLESGPKAKLRRSPLQNAGSADFWRLVLSFNLGGNVDNWALVMQGMAIMTPTGSVHGNTVNLRKSHDPKRKLGSVLAQPSDNSLGLSELRFQRLLKAKDKTRHDLAIRACRMLAAKSASCDWTHFAWLIIHGDTKPYGGKRISRLIARDYYNTLLNAEKGQPVPAKKES